MSDEFTLVERLEYLSGFVFVCGSIMFHCPLAERTFTAANLRTIADELDRRNKEWDAMVKAEAE